MTELKQQSKLTLHPFEPKGILFPQIDTLCCSTANTLASPLPKLSVGVNRVSRFVERALDKGDADA